MSCGPCCPSFIFGGGAGGGGGLPASAAFRAQLVNQVLAPSPNFVPLECSLVLLDVGNHYNPVGFVWQPPAGIITLGAMTEIGGIDAGVAVELAIGKNGGSFPFFIGVGPQATGSQSNFQTNGCIVMVTDLANGTDLYSANVRSSNNNFSLIAAGPNSIFFGMSGGIPGM